MSDQPTVWGIVRKDAERPRRPVKLRKGYAARLRPSQLAKIHNALEAESRKIDNFSGGLLNDPADNRYEIVEFHLTEIVRD